MCQINIDINMKLIFSFFLLFIVFFHAAAQNELKGKWYSFSFDMYKVVEYSFDPTNFVINNLDWELKKQPMDQLARIIKTVNSRDNLYYLLKGGRDTSIINLMICSSVSAGNSFVQSTASPKHTEFKTLADALAFIQVDTLKRPGLIFYSEKEFSRLKSLPDISTITKENYVKYLHGLIQVREEFEKFAQKSKKDFGFMFFIVYLPNQARKILADLGYNPVIDDKHVESINEKFKDDKTLKELMDNALKFE